ncbi:sodium:solute symporter family protein [Virgibacillus sp. NKC19-3]|uniref:sodium:solute symporter family protein n=1 Tax=Virgibacillus saliphilus TaxID=2831674 RepID=UPI001C9B1787|nr:sodium:solute symporter family protein [Virgibacillus sp. NKC19-3]MBY7144461.1 sodium:solute symporter family protein [Virgibacillus sp. NKC19-3]
MTATLMIVLSTSVLLLLSVGFSFWISYIDKKAENWTVGGRKLPVYVVAGTQYATGGMGGGVLVASVGIGYSSGWSALTYNALYALGVLLLVFLVGWLHKHNFSTMPDILKKLYGENKFMIILVTVLAIILPFGWLCAQLVAFGSLFTSITGISVDYLIPIFAVICLLFVLPGGMNSVAWTDFLFGIVILIMTFVSGIYVVNAAGGWGEIVQSVPSRNVNFPDGLGGAGMYTIFLWIFAILPGALTNQMSFQRIYASKSPKVAKQGFIIAAILGVLSGTWASVMGISIYTMNPDLGNPELAAGWLLAQIPVGFMALYAAFIVSTIMSTLSSALQSVVVNLTKDIYEPFINPGVSNKKIVRISRLLTVVIMLLSIILALYFPWTLGWMESSYAYSASGLLVPIFGGFILKNSRLLTKQGAIGSMVVGIISTAIAHLVDTSLPYVIFGLIGSLITFIILNFIYKNKEISLETKPKEA